jgi:hypothetical protein
MEATMLSLQRSVGNRAVSSIVAQGGPGLAGPAAIQRSACGGQCGCAECGPSDEVARTTDAAPSGGLAGKATTGGITPGSALEQLADQLGVVEFAKLVAEYGIAGVKKIAAVVEAVGIAVVRFEWWQFRCITALPLRAGVALAEYVRAPTPKTAATFRPFIDLACDCLPDAILIGVVEHIQMHKQPLAVAHLEHYLHGGGADFFEDVATFLARDAGGKAAIEAGINAAGKAQGVANKSFTGWAHVMQKDYSLKEYLHAWGSVCCDPADAGDQPGAFYFRVLDDPASRAQNRTTGQARVELRMRDHYMWHPLEERPTQCLHKMLEAQKAAGAKEYFQVGGPVTVDLNIDSPLIPT